MPDTIKNTSNLICEQSFDDVLNPFVFVCDLMSDALDMIQAGGGNASAKYSQEGHPEMLIKASGFLMSEVTPEKGYAKVMTDDILSIMADVHSGQISCEDETIINERIAHANLGVLRPSIETFLHALLPQRYVLHTHALTTLVYTSSKMFDMDLKNSIGGNRNFYFLDENNKDAVLLIPYEKPGIHLAMAMKTALDQFQAKHNLIPKYILLQNHGLIVASDDEQQLFTMIEKIEHEIKRRMNLPDDFDKPYRQQQSIKTALKAVWPKKRYFVRLNEDRHIQHLEPSKIKEFLKMSFPDALVFCGLEPLCLEKTDDESIAIQMQNYHKKWNEAPKLIVLDHHLYYIGESIKKCLEVQEVLSIQWRLNTILGEQLKVLTEEQAHVLLNWEAEKYRKNL